MSAKIIPEVKKTSKKNKQISLRAFLQSFGRSNPHLKAFLIYCKVYSLSGMKTFDEWDENFKVYKKKPLEEWKKNK